MFRMQRGNGECEEVLTPPLHKPRLILNISSQPVDQHLPRQNIPLTLSTTTVTRGLPTTRYMKSYRIAFTVGKGD